MKKNNRIVTFIDKIDGIIIVISLVIYVLLLTLSEFLPQVSNYVNERGGFVLIAITLLIVLRHIGHLNSLYNTREVYVTDEFAEACRTLVTDIKEIKTLDVFAYSSKRVLEFWKDYLRANDISVGTIRVLLRDYNVDTMRFAFTEDQRKEFLAELVRSGKDWKALKGKVQKSRLRTNVRYYDFDPLCYFIILNGRYLLYGPFRIHETMAGVETGSIFVYKQVALADKKLLADCQSMFDCVWETAYLSTDTPIYLNRAINPGEASLA